MSVESLIVLIVVGGVSGWLATRVTGRRGLGIVGNVVVGILGAFVGGYVLGRLGFAFGGGIVGAVIHAFVGAVLVLVTIGILKRA
jgi:uncharacterized membrane protein YeaQ/YmgE (transglycosylase-associated protein family)